jgi:hypothetical protein
LVDPTYPFLAVLAVYVLYSAWARLDSRLPLAAAVALLAATVVSDAVGALGTANVLAAYVFYLLCAGVVLLLIDHIRAERALRAPGSAPTPETGR